MSNAVIVEFLQLTKRQCKFPSAEGIIESSVAVLAVAVSGADLGVRCHEPRERDRSVCASQFRQLAAVSVFESVETAIRSPNLSVAPSTSVSVLPQYGVEIVDATSSPESSGHGPVHRSLHSDRDQLCEHRSWEVDE